MNWLRADVDGDLGLEQALIRARESQTPVDPFLAALHLRWWQARVLAPESRIRWPKSVEFERAWSWKEKRVRNLLAREEEWGDPRLSEAWKAYRGRNEAGTGPDEGRKEAEIDQVSNSEIPDLGRNRDGTGTEPGRKEGDTRGVGSRSRSQEQRTAAGDEPSHPPSLTLVPQPPPPKPKPPSRIDQDFDRVCDYVVSTFSPATGVTRPERPQKTTGRGKALLSAIRRGDTDLVLDALRWVAEGPDPFHRQRECTVLSALKHMDDYAEKWRSWRAPPAIPPPQPAPTPSETRIRPPPPLRRAP